MLKTITPFEIVDAATRKVLHDDLESLLTHETADDPEKTAWWSAGFTAPHPNYSGPVFISGDNVTMLNVQIRERVLPAKVIKEQLKLEIASAAERQGYKPNRKQIAELKEQVVDRLLPGSHIRPMDIPVMITGDFLLIGTSSANKVDIVLSLLNRVFFDADEEPMKIRPIATKRNVRPFLSDLLLSGSTESCHFTSKNAVVLKGEDKSVARYKGVDITSEAVKDSVSSGMYPVELEMTYNSVYDFDEQEARILFSLTDQLQLKRVKFSDILLSEVADQGGSDDDADRNMAEFEASMSITGGELRKALNLLLQEIPVSGDDDNQEADDEGEL